MEVGRCTRWVFRMGGMGVGVGEGSRGLGGVGDGSRVGGKRGVVGEGIMKHDGCSALVVYLREAWPTRYLVLLGG